jgi:hypothetical protein
MEKIKTPIDFTKDVWGPALSIITFFLLLIFAALVMAGCAGFPNVPGEVSVQIKSEGAYGGRKD